MDAPTRSWTARAIAFERVEDDAHETLALGESADGEGPVLMVQRATAFDEQDVENGQATYCLVDEMGRVHYGGVTGWSVVDGVLSLDLDEVAAGVFGTRRFEVRLASDLIDVRGVIAKLLA